MIKPIARIACLVLAASAPSIATAQFDPPLEVTAGQPIQDETGTALEGSNRAAESLGLPFVEGCLVQVLDAGANGVADPPDSAGGAGGDDRILHRTSIGEGIAPDVERSGRFAISFHPPPRRGTKVFVRAFNRPDPAEATHWGDSGIFTVVPLEVLDVSKRGLTRTSRKISRPDETE